MSGDVNESVQPVLRRRRPVAGLCVVALLVFAAVACSDDAGSPAQAEGPLGVVRVAQGEAVQIRALLYTDNEAGTGYTNLRVVRLAVEDFGPIHGFDVHVGEPHNDHCSPDGGRGAAETIIADEDVIGVIGTSCSTAAVEAAPLLTGAGLVMISPTNTSPTLTSDLAGNPSRHYSEGYYRTAHNDLYQAEAVARFLYEKMGVTAAATIHVGDVYTRSLAEAFIDAFEELGGEITGFRTVNRSQTGMVPPLTGLALNSPQAIFLPVSQTVGESIVKQAPDVAGLEDVLLVSADGLLADSFLELEETEGMFFSGPGMHFDDNTNESTGRTAYEVLAAYDDFYGSPPGTAFWGHAYDATTLLLAAIEAASYLDGDSLVIDRAGVREHLDGVAGYAGIIGAITCDDFGDCGLPDIHVIEHLDSADIPTSRDNAVYEYGHTGPSHGN